VRINLVDPDKGKGKRRKDRGRTGRRGRSRRYDSAIPYPQIHDRRGREHREDLRTLADLSEEDDLPRVRVTIPWRALLVRMPVFLVLAGLIGMIVYISSDAQFFVYEAEIEGVHHLKSKKIYESAQVHQQSIFWIQPSQVEDNIRQLNGIKDVEVHCRLPARVVVRVEEREPIVLWRLLTQEQDYWLDEEGVVLPYHGDPTSPDVVIVADSSDRQLQEGARIEPASLVRSVQQLAVALPQVEFIFYGAERGLSFTQKTDRGEWPVYVGTSEDLARKIGVVQALNVHLAEHQIQPRYVDVRLASHPVYGRPAGELEASDE